MRCEQVMTKDPVCCVPGDSVVRAAKLMKTEDAGSIPVCEGRESRKLVGIITDRDLAIQVVAAGHDPNSVKIQDVMTKNPFTCHPGDNLQNAVEAMERHQVRRIPIVNDRGELIGIIAQADVATRAAEPEQTAELVQEVSRSGARAA